MPRGHDRSGREHDGNTAMRSFWQALYDAGADVVLSGHEHNYERFAPQDPNGSPDGQRGTRQFVVGTGGASHDSFGTPPISEVRKAETRRAGADTASEWVRLGIRFRGGGQ